MPKEDKLYYILPICGKCHKPIYNLSVNYIPELSHAPNYIATHFDPWYCPYCNTDFSTIEVNLKEHTAIALPAQPIS